MTGLDAQTSHQWSLASLMGYEHPLFIINSETVLYTWALLLILLVVACIARALLRTQGQARFIVLSGISFIVDLTKQALGFFSFNHFAFIATIFIFITLANTLSAIPWLDEPTNDINTTFALSFLTFLYTQYTAISSVGISHYLKSCLSPMLPLHIVGKLASIISLSCRLFGNIAGGAIIVTMYFSYVIRSSPTYELIGIGILSVLIAFFINVYRKKPPHTLLHVTLLALFFSPNMIITLFFTLFEGCLQAFVFTMLSLSYLANTLQGEGH